ncbi:MAG: SigE family RNA polymerase sigma factor [Marmoricola sp.]
MPEGLESPALPADFEAYVAARGSALQQFAFLVTRDHGGAADLVQDVLERAWQRWDDMVAAGTTESYLLRSIANGAVSRWRKLRRLISVAEPIGHEAAAPGDDAGVAWLLCAELPPVQRVAVVLRFYEDLPYAEIATILGCAEATARSHVHRALQALRTRLREGEEDD